MMGDSQSVASLIESVESLCSDIIHYIESTRTDSTVSSEDVRNLWETFKLWASNIGARQHPNPATSPLETRLKGKGRILEQVAGLLNDIQEALDDLLEIVSGYRESRRIVLGSTLVDEDPVSLQSSKFDNAGFSKLESDEAQDIIGILADCIGSLSKIAVLIRKATPSHDRFARPLQSLTDDSDISYVAMKYPKLGEPGSRWLCERLGRAITMRRHFLRYSREQNRRVIGHDDGSASSSPSGHRYSNTSSHRHQRLKQSEESDPNQYHGRADRTRHKSDDEWNAYKPTLYQLYMVERLDLNQVQETMGTKYMFLATLKNFKERFRLWGWFKNYQNNDTKIMGDIAQHATPEGEASVKTAGSNFQSTTVGTGMSYVEPNPSHDQRVLGQVKDTEADDGPRMPIVTAESSFQSGTANHTLCLATLEEVSQRSDVFECPICFGIQTISEESSWKYHAFQDLKAYVCTRDKGCDTIFFGDSRSWFDHEMQCHRQQWSCILCSQGPFKSKNLLEDHATQTHGDVIVRGNQMTALIGAGLRVADAIPAGDCPFCNEWAESLSTTSMPNSTAFESVDVTVDPEKYRQHVSQHLEQLALVALPRLEDGDHQASDAAPTGEQLLSTPTRGTSIWSNHPIVPTLLESKK